MSGSSVSSAEQPDPGPSVRALRASAPHRLLSSLPFHKVPFWTASVQTVSARPCQHPGLWRHAWARYGVPDPGVIFRLLRAAPHADAVLINGGERADLIYLALAGLLPWIRAPHVVVDAHWQPGETALLRLLQRATLRLGRSLLAEVQIHTEEEVDHYVRNFGLPRQVLRPLPWSTSLNGYRAARRVGEGREIVTGGHSFRDYPTLFEAVRGQDWPVLIGLPPSHATQEVTRLAADCPNVRVVSDWTLEEYWQSVADSRVFVMPIVPGLQRCTADQTMLNAMALGTIVVATNALSSRLYIRHGENGFLVPEGDAPAWRRTLADVFAMPPGQAQRIRDAAQLAARTTFSEEERLARTLERTAQAAAAWRLDPGATPRAR
jgi:glycosyltransferase involved in cell wall biosynthesis